jgi:hypothetical protein
MEGRLKKIGNEYKLYAQDDSCIATSWHSPHQRLSKKNCEAIVNGYDLNELTEFDVEILSEKFFKVKGNDGTIIYAEAMEEFDERNDYKLDADGCLILKRK